MAWRTEGQADRNWFIWAQGDLKSWPGGQKAKQTGIGLYEPKVQVAQVGYNETHSMPGGIMTIKAPYPNARDQ